MKTVLIQIICVHVQGSGHGIVNNSSLILVQVCTWDGGGGVLALI